MTMPQSWPPVEPHPTLGYTGQLPAIEATSASGQLPVTPYPGYPPPGYPPPRRRVWLPITIIGVVLALIAGAVATALSVTGSGSSKSLVEGALTEAGSWPAVRYHGLMTNYGRDAVDVDVTVVKGELGGTLSRPGGGRAEIAWDSRGMVLKGNRQWWSGGSSYANYAGRFEDVWISDPPELSVVQQLAALEPAELKRSMKFDMPFLWDNTKAEKQQLDGKDVLVADQMGRRVFVDASTHRFVAVDSTTYGSPKPEPLRAEEADEAAASRVRGVAAKVRESESPKTTSQKMNERADVDGTVVSEQPCDKGICATITLSNAGTGRMLGTIDIMANASKVATLPLDLAAGRSTTIQVAAPAGTRQPIYWSFWTREGS
ncbi:hypothetical protein ACQEVB_08545 [Pseudonocardia sp. CA-107938]|uniref:hypothetical protein n=1 Tax=Pseudonocardia sp. CA-107938 TaxID=3240021 RepID=UPI003D8A642D